MISEEQALEVARRMPYTFESVWLFCRRYNDMKLAAGRPATVEEFEELVRRGHAAGLGMPATFALYDGRAEEGLQERLVKFMLFSRQFPALREALPAPPFLPIQRLSPSKPLSRKAKRRGKKQ